MAPPASLFLSHSCHLFSSILSPFNSDQKCYGIIHPLRSRCPFSIETMLCSPGKTESSWPDSVETMDSYTLISDISATVTKIIFSLVAAALIGNNTSNYTLFFPSGSSSVSLRLCTACLHLSLLHCSPNGAFGAVMLRPVAAAGRSYIIKSVSL